MKKLYLLFISILTVAQTNAQGVNRMFGLVGGYPQSDNSSNGFLFSTDSSGQNFQVQYQFPVTVSGANPQNVEMASYNGKLYGTTAAGGVANFGTIFEYDPATNIYTKKFDFGSNSTLYGCNPRAGLLLYNSKFYGVASSCGASGNGTIYEWDPATNVFTKKYELALATGNNVQSAMRLMNGKMYGTCVSGGANGLGCVFEWDPGTNILTDIFDLTGPNPGNGYNFYCNVTPYNNKIYCSSWQGAANGGGALYMIDPALPNGSNTTVIKIFDGTSGTNCNNNEMVVYNNKLYGMLYYNGAFSYGTLFELDPATNIFTKLVDFNYTTTGGNPVGKLVLNGTKFLGMCNTGGANGKGTIYEWDPANPTTVVKKYDFGVSNYDNPINPGSTLVLFNSKFYATTYNGGFNDQGSLFEYDYATGTVTKKLNFNTAENGRIPYGRPTLLNGKIYGTCYTAPQPDGGCIWEYDPSTTVYSRKFNFDYNTSSGVGNHPTASPIAYNGKLYGTTNGGGLNNYGVFYEFDPSTNTYSKKDFFSINGLNVIGEPTFYNGKFYGMTNAGGTGNNGTIYSYDPATATLVKLYDVQNSGCNTPTGGFTAYNNKLYGTAAYGGTGNLGGIIMYDPVANTASTVYSFPAGGLMGYNVQNVMTAYNNKLYGNAASGGNGGHGAIFEFDPATNNYTVVYHYSTVAGSGGYDPTGILTLNGNKFYTTTRYFSDIIVSQFDAATNTVTQRSVYTPASTYNMPGYHNALTVVPAFIANGIANSCEVYPSVVINSSNNNKWVPILNTSGDVVAEINANGNNLGNVNVSAYINSGTTREDALHQLYGDRNITIEVQNNTIVGNVDIRLYLKTSEFLALKNATNTLGQPSGISTINDIALLKNSQACSSVLSVNPSVLTTTNEAYEYGYVLKASVNSFSTFFFAKNTFTVLPVDLVSFNAAKDNDKVLLSWNSENEINLQRYDVERSSDGRTFTKINEVKAKGNSTNTYNITDAAPLSGLNYYRLKIIDKDGTFRYSIILKADFSKKYLVSVLPNPAHDYIIINGANKFKRVQLIDMNGKIIKQFTVNSNNRYTTTGIPQGVYLLQLINDDEQQTEKIIIQ